MTSYDLTHSLTPPAHTIAPQLFTASPLASALDPPQAVQTHMTVTPAYCTYASLSSSLSSTLTGTYSLKQNTGRGSSWVKGSCVEEGTTACLGVREGGARSYSSPKHDHRTGTGIQGIGVPGGGVLLFFTACRHPGPRSRSYTHCSVAVEKVRLRESVTVNCRQPRSSCPTPTPPYGNIFWMSCISPTCRRHRSRPRRRLTFHPLRRRRPGPRGCPPCPSRTDAPSNQPTNSMNF